jgi:hypothetical protein
MSKSVRKGMSATGLARVTWRKSTHSGQLGNCIEAAWHQARPVGTPTMCAPNAALACKRQVRRRSRFTVSVSSRGGIGDLY